MPFDPRSDRFLEIQSAFRGIEGSNRDNYMRVSRSFRLTIVSKIVVGRAKNQKLNYVEFVVEQVHLIMLNLS